MRTIATAKVPLGFAASLVEERNYNCYNVYFNECLPRVLAVRFFSFWGQACAKRRNLVQEFNTCTRFLSL